MGNNIECYEAYHVGRDVGLIPDPQMDRSFTGYLSPNSSAHLNSNYMDVRLSLSPEQLGTFNHSLRATLGESGKVTQGGVGVVALALSLLFDTLAQQAKNQTGTTHFIHKVFGEHEDGKSSEIGTIVTNYLKLVPLIANDPQRMKKETDRYEQRLNRSLVSHFESTVNSKKSSCAALKIFIHGFAFHQHMMIQQVRMGAGVPQERLFENRWEKYSYQIAEMDPVSLDEITNGVERLRNISPGQYQLVTKCPSLVTIFVKIVLEEGKFFILNFQRNVPHFLRQNEDFFY